MSERGTSDNGSPPNSPTSPSLLRLSATDFLDSELSYQSPGIEFPLTVPAYERTSFFNTDKDLSLFLAPTAPTEDLEKPAYESSTLAVWHDDDGELIAVRDADGTIYRVSELAGAGATGSVYKVTDPAGRVLAMKVMPRGRYAEAEVRALEKLRHQNVMRLEGVARDTVFRQAFLFFEFIDGGELCNMTSEGKLVGSRWTETAARRVLLDLAASVAHLHQNDVVHRDIKPQ
eukprot:Hpha_TRINITY_DN15600_c0_g2::TRINITY_DN15600_c0_g2_i1::g.97771::m.97771